MHNKKHFNKKIFAIYVALSFFFLGIFIVISYFIFGSKIDYYASLINTTAIKGDSESTTTTIDLETRKITKYPSWGAKYATINLPTIDLSMPVFYGDSLKILKYGVGTFDGAYMPGEGGTIIMPSHNALDGFGKIPGLEKGDKIVVDTTYGSFEYSVDSYKIVQDTQLDAFPIQDEKEMLILYTCYPINKSVVGRKTLRYVVYANRVGGTYEK